MSDRMAVVRPRDPQLALRLAHELLREASKAPGLSPEEQQRRFNANLRAQEHVFVGLLSGVRVVDHEGNDLGETLPGDVYIDYDELVAKTTKPEGA